MKEKITLFWFRRDLRLHDNAGLYHALKHHNNVLPLFIFDTSILDKLEDRDDARVTFIYDTIQQLRKQLRLLGSELLIRIGKPLQVYKEIVNGYEIEAIYTNHDYEPYARERDISIHAWANENGIPFRSFKDQVIFEKEEVTKDDGSPYTVYTPYSKKWKAKISNFYLSSYPYSNYFDNLYKTTILHTITINDIGFKRSSIEIPSANFPTSIVSSYNQTRDFPSLNGTSRLSVHLRFGTVSIRELAKKAFELNEVWLNELIWRDFYHMILWHFPNPERAFKPQYDNIEWRNDEDEFAAWCDGKTGYPIVDAGMRELNATGFMHNRVRMIVASFLTKHLLIDWRWGEAYFARKLLDFDLAANNGGWQWAAGSGCDAAPYFRVFNPYLQTKKFDPELKYIKQWVPEFQEFTSYPQPIVDHDYARKRVLDVYKKALN